MSLFIQYCLRTRACMGKKTITSSLLKLFLYIPLYIGIAIVHKKCTLILKYRISLLLSISSAIIYLCTPYMLWYRNLRPEIIEVLGYLTWTKKPPYYGNLKYPLAFTAEDYFRFANFRANVTIVST